VILLLLFILAAAANMTVFRRNRQRSYKFLFSILIGVFCVARVAALALRIAWAAHPHDVRVALAAQIFTSAGVLILFVTNLVFAQRIIRAYHPFFGWSRGVKGLFVGLFGSAAVVLVMVVAVTVQGYFVGRGAGSRVRTVDRRVQLFCATYLAVYAFLPVPLVTAAAVVPRRTRIDKFGEGHFRTKFALLTCTASLLAVGAIFRAVVAYSSRPVEDPGWFHNRGCYYCFNYVIELVVVFTYALSRFDRRFHIPDGSSAPGHYSCAEFSPAALSAVAAAAAAADAGRRTGRGGGRLCATKKNETWQATKGEERRRSSGSARSGTAASSSYGEGPSEQSSLVRDADLAWMARAMVGFGPSGGMLRLLT
jgi:hypothetical protein